MVPEFQKTMLPVLPGVHFLPWVGTSYKSQLRRLLVLGESHYSHNETEPGSLTVELTQKFTEGHFRHRYWTNITKVLQGDSSDPARLWSNISFYNYIQELVGPKARISPTEEMFSSAKPGFESVLTLLKPTHILVLSKRLWQNLPNEIFLPATTMLFHGKERETRKVLIGEGQYALSTWLPHPSYHFHFNARALFPAVQEFLNI